MARARFISFEGGEGAGKSTLMTSADQLLSDLGVAHIKTREPGGTPLGESLRRLVLEAGQHAVCAEAELLMMFASRAQHVVETIRPALDAGQWVMSDRFTDASFAYQGGGRGLPVARIEELERWAAFGLRPDRTYLLDVPVEIGLQRVRARGESDRMEREAVAFFERVRAAYRARAAADPARFVVLDAARPLDEVVAAMREDLTRLIHDSRAVTA